MKLDTDEKELLESVDRGEWKSSGSGKQERTRFSRYAKATFRKDRRAALAMCSPPKLDETRYLPDAVLIFPEVGKFDRDSAVAAIREENAAGRHWATVDFATVSVLMLAPQAALLTYQASARWNGEEVESKTLCATAGDASW